MENDLLKIDYKVVQEWENAVIMPNHIVVFTQTIQLCKGVIMSYVRTDTKKPTTATYTL